MKTRQDAIRVFAKLGELVDELYSEYSTGGPLHITTDDGNVEDHSLVFCFQQVHNGQYPEHIQNICVGILHELMLMTEPQRVIWWIEKSIEEEGLDPTYLAVSVRDGIVERVSNGGYDERILSRPMDGEEQKVLWEGLDQLRARQKSEILSGHDSSILALLVQSQSLTSDDKQRILGTLNGRALEIARAITGEEKNPKENIRKAADGFITWAKGLNSVAKI